MDTGLSAYSTTAYLPRQAPAGEVALRAEPSTDVAADRRETADAERRRDDERRTEFDAETGSMIYRLVDIDSGLTVKQTPDEARLRLRAYLDRMEARGAAAELERTA